MNKKITTEVISSTSSAKKIAGMTGMLLMASAAIATILTWFISQ